MGARILVVDDSPTIRKVVASILESRDYEALSAVDGQDALEKLGEEPVDLVLLDFVMPHMNGYQFCRELRAHDDLKGLPVVLMSAKGDRIRGQFVRQTGAIDAITKPFDALGLIAVIEGALKKKQEGRARPIPDAAAMPDDEDAVVDSLRPGSGSFNENPAAQLESAAREVGASLVHLLTPRLLECGSDPESLRSTILTAVTPDTLRSVATVLRSTMLADSSADALSGDISVISIAEILQLLQLQRQTGTLVITSPRAQVTLHVREGNLELATSRGLPAEFLLGRYLVEADVLTKERLREALSASSSSEELLGEHLISISAATQEQVRAALIQQSSELVYEVVRWKRGRFSLTVDTKSPAAAAAALGLPTGGLVMEGFRRVDEWRLIEGSFDFDDVLYRDEVAIENLGENSELTGYEQQVLDAIDGERTIREVVDSVKGSSFELCKFIYQFLNSRLVRLKKAS